MIMTPEETKLLIELKDALTDTLSAVKAAFANSGYYQHIQYKADNDKYENWLFRAREAQTKAENFLKEK